MLIYFQYSIRDAVDTCFLRHFLIFSFFQYSIRDAATENLLTVDIYNRYIFQYSIRDAPPRFLPTCPKQTKPNFQYSIRDARDKDKEDNHVSQ